MFLVDQPALYPGQCMFTCSSEGPLVDFDRDFLIEGENAHVGRMYAKLSFIVETAVKFGDVVPTAELDRALEDNAALRAELERMAAENLEMSQHQDAIDYFAKKGYIAKRAPGRPVQKKEAVDA